MKTILNTVLSLGEVLRLRTFVRVSSSDWTLYFACLAGFALVLAAGNWVAERGASNDLETWVGSSAVFLFLALITRFSARLRG